MKLRILFVTLMVAFMANAAFGAGQIYWQEDVVANWSAYDPEDEYQDPIYWWIEDSVTPPDDCAWSIPTGTREIQIYGTGSVLTVNAQSRNASDPIGSPSGDVSFTSWFSNRSRIFGGATVNIETGGTLGGMGWLRLGESSKAGHSQVNQTGGMMMFVNGGYHGTAWEAGKDAARLTISDGGKNVAGAVDGKGTYTISGGTLTYDKVKNGELTIGDRMGDGTLKIIGTGGRVDFGQLEMAGRYDKPAESGRGAKGTLEFELHSEGMNAAQAAQFITSVRYTPDAGLPTGTSILTVNLTEALADEDAVIVLVRNSGGSATAQIFDTFNGVAAVEGAAANIGLGVVRLLTYTYNAELGEEGTGNDIALLVPEPATLALLSLGMFVIRRKK